MLNYILINISSALIFFNSINVSAFSTGKGDELLQYLSHLEPPVNHIYNFNEGNTPPIFYPADLKNFIGLNSMKDHFISNKNGVFYIPDGTERVYKLIHNNGKFKFLRIDRSFFTGHTFHALNFSFRDSIYSLSGYGFGHANSQLRVFLPDAGIWKFIKMNQQVVVNLRSNPGIWVDLAGEKIWTTSHLDVNQVQDFSHFSEKDCDSIVVRYLDPHKGFWQTSGSISPEFLNFLKSNIRIGQIPGGELVLDTVKFQISLINYKKNKVLEISQEKNKAFLEKYLKFRKNHQRLYTWASFEGETIFKLFSENDEIFSSKLQGSDFSDTRLKILNSVENSWWRDDRLMQYSLFIGGCVSFIFFGYWLRSVQKMKVVSKFSIKPELIFNEVELSIISSLEDAPENVLTTESLNEFLGTSKKTIEVQKKQRSDTIKSINDKYRRLMNDPEPLIVQDRMQDDRRQVRYILDSTKYAVLFSRIFSDGH